MQQSLPARSRPASSAPGAFALAVTVLARRLIAGDIGPRPRLLAAGGATGGCSVEMTRPDRAITAGRARAERSRQEGADVDRFSDLILPHLDAAYNLARYLSRDADASQDIVQEAFLRAFRSFAQFRGGNPRAWILAIVRNCYRTWRADLQRIAGPAENRSSETGWAEDDFDDSEPEAVASDAENPESALLRSDEAETVRAVLDALPEPFREIMVLRELEDLSYREIADITALPIGTVMSRLARARGAFRTEWRCRVQRPEDAL